MTEHNTRRTLGLLVAALAVALVAFGLAGGASAQLVDDNVTVSDPGNQQIEVDVSFSNSADVTAALETDGSTVESATVSGTAGTSDTLVLDTTGLQSGEFALNISATDETNVTVDDTRMITQRYSALNVSQNDTVLVDVEFDSAETTSATVNLSNNGAQVNTTTLSFDPVQFEDGSGIKTAEFELDTDYTALNATVETTPASGYSEAWVSVDDDSAFLGAGGIIAGASRNQILGFLAVVLGLALAYNRDYI